MAGRWGYGEQHCREKVRDYVSRIRSLKKLKITFRDLNPKCEYLPVDVVHMICQEFRCTPGTKWWSHKSNGPGVAYELVTDPVDGKIRWINGPYPPSKKDITILRGGKAREKSEWDRSALYFQVPNNVMLVGDSAYGGQPDKVTTTKDAHGKTTKNLFARMKSLQETTFKRLKDFKVLRESFRHGSGTLDKLKKHKIAMEATAVLVEYDIENGHPLFEV